jgi:2',3'-cyclic-nucleotide 2'-phosphodiesterase (5'-nucleotidase family)
MPNFDLEKHEFYWGWGSTSFTQELYVKVCNVTGLRRASLMPRAKLGFLAGVLLLLAGLAHAKPVHILVTGDMHGWLEPLSAGSETLGGAAETLAAWKDQEGYTRDQFLVLSAGDIATGPALSTAYAGEPDVEAMNLMGYDVSALGNHEFDFGMDQLQKLRSMASFPFVSANVLISETSTATLVQPFVVVEKLGVKIGVIGLMTTSLKQLSITGPILATDYAEALRLWAPKARAAGAELLVVLAHVPLNELRDTAAQVGDLGIPLMLGGHSHELGQTRDMVSGTWIVNSGEWWKAYSRIDMDFNEATGKTKLLSSKQVWLQQDKPKADPVVKAVIEKWEKRLAADPAMGSVLGYLGSPLPRFWPAFNFVCDAWLAMDPDSDLALDNDGSLRQDLAAGPLRKADLLSLMPFNDALYRLKLNGRQVKALLPRAPGKLMGMAGLAKVGKSWILTKSGKKLSRDGNYSVLINSYMLETMPQLKAHKNEAVLVAKNWRDPLEAWLKDHPSNAENPLNKILDAKPRI